MLSCSWVQPAQLHPWYKPATLKRKSPSMSLRSEPPSPSPVDDEDDPDARIKRPRRSTTFRLEEHTHPRKRKLPSCPQSPTEEAEAEDLAMATKRQRCMALEDGIERLSLTPPGLPAYPPEFATLLSAPGAPPDFRFSQWLPALPPAAVPPGLQQTSPPTNLDLSSALLASADAIEDVKMRSSSWYEPEKDSACATLHFEHRTPLTCHRATGIIVTDLDASSDDEDGVDDAPKLPRDVLQALLRGGSGLLPLSFAPRPPGLSAVAADVTTTT
jgi:hypothetical protein